MKLPLASVISYVIMYSRLTPYFFVDFSNKIRTVAHNGDVALLSPELVNYREFVAGNVLKDSLLQIAEGWIHKGYVADFVAGVNACRKQCPYFCSCLGGTAGNKFFELGTTNGTETVFCRNSEQRLIKAILASLGGDIPRSGIRDLRKEVRKRTLAIDQLLDSVSVPGYKM